MIEIKDIENKIDDFFNSIPCQSNIPMPEIKVEGPNLDYADLLLEPYASSSDSELQVIAQYIYHSKTIENSTISKALMCIALNEMGHLDTLSELITLLGGKPYFINSNGSYWMSGNVAYVDKKNIYQNNSDKETIKQKLERNIISEVNVVNGYDFILQNIKDKYIKKVIYKIKCDEEVHVKILENLIKKYL